MQPLQFYKFNANDNVLHQCSYHHHQRGKSKNFSSHNFYRWDGRGHGKGPGKFHHDIVCWLKMMLCQCICHDCLNSQGLWAEWEWENKRTGTLLDWPYDWVKCITLFLPLDTYTKPNSIILQLNVNRVRVIFHQYSNFTSS